MSAAAVGRHDLVVLVAGLAGVVAWDASGADLPVVRWFADAHGFFARDAWWASTVLHDGGRFLAWVVAAALLLTAVRTPATGVAPSRDERLFWLGVALSCALVVPALKRWSVTSCPWDLAQFGGVARYVSHWRPGVTDGGSGRCFPAGHPVAAFAFFALYLQWRGHDARRARAWLLGVLVAGAMFGGVQTLRGAHYPSHTLWTAWLCAALCAVAARLRPQVGAAAAASA